VQANRRAGRRTGRSKERRGIELLRERTSPSSEFMRALAPIPKSRESRPEIALSTWSRPPRPKPTATIHHPRSLSHTRTCDELICKLPYREVIKLFPTENNFVSLAYKYFALCSRKITFFEKKEYIQFVKTFGTLPVSANNFLKIKIVIKQFFNCVCFNFRFKLLRTDQFIMCRRTRKGSKQRCGTVGTGNQRIRVCRLLDLWAIANKSYPAMYVRLAYRYRRSNASAGPYAMQKFAKTATASNFSSMLDITSRCDVPN
jgi:hypothetical protein